MGIATGRGSGARPDNGFVLPTFCFLFCLFCVVAAVAAPKGPRVVVVVPPGGSPARMLAIVTRSGGALVAATSRPWIAVAQGDASDFSSRLLSNGAVLTLDGAMAFLCSTGESGS